MKSKSTIQVSVIIKTLNEEKNIRNTIQSAMDALNDLNGEIILADSFSTDRTVEIASEYPIRVVRLKNSSEKCCGIGGQLGYQYAKGQFIWIVDGDMTLNKNFLTHALNYLNENPKTAGVGGKVEERNLDSLEFRARVQRAPRNLQPGLVDRLDGGGVYRRTAIESIQYFTNRNLHSYEEYELAVRLRNKGWDLHRIDLVATSHFGHKTEAYKLLGKRWRSGYALGIGELLRSSIGREYFKLLISEVREIRVYFLVIIWWLTMTLFVAAGLTRDSVYLFHFILLLALPFCAMSLKKRSITTGIYSVVSWNIYALGLVKGFTKTQIQPSTNVASDELSDYSTHGSNS